jgi:Ala-tRNA(Pro) deacylase
LPATRNDLLQRLKELGVTSHTVEHPAVFTVAESEALEREIPGGHTKNLFLKDAKGRLFLVIAESHTNIDLKTLHKKLGSARLSFGKAELLESVLGVKPGSVTAFALMNDRDLEVQPVIDKKLMSYDTVNCHPLENTATTNVALEGLLRFIQACGHDAQVMALGRDDEEGDQSAESNAQKTR